MRDLSVSDYFVEFLIANGVTEVFGYQGGMIAYLFDSLGRYKDQINYRSCATEQGAALAACGYAQATGKIGVAISTSGPGFTNLVTGIADAWFDSVPVLFVSGNVNTKDKKRTKPVRQLGFQEIQAATIAKEITKKVYEFELDTDYQKVLNEAYTVAMSARRGPVYIDLPINVCRERIKIDEAKPCLVDKAQCDFDIDYILEKIKSHTRPVIIAGAGIKQAGCVDLFRKVVNKLNIPVVTTLPAIDVLPSDSKYMMGYIGGTARREGGIVLQNADLVLSIGTRLCSKQIGHNMELFAPKADSFIRVDIDKTEFSHQIKDEEEDIYVDIEIFLKRIHEKSDCVGRNEKWVSACTNIKKLLASEDITKGNFLVKTITEVLTNDSNIVFDVGKNMTYCGQSSVIKDKTKTFTSAGLGTMGYALPAAIGAALGNQKPTFVFSGDGGMQMNIQELNTIVKNDIPIKIIVFNNRALGNIRIFQEQYLDERYVATSELEGDYFSCDFKSIAEAYGMKAIRYDNEIDIEEISELVVENRAVLIEIVYDDCQVLPGIVAGGEFLAENTGLELETISKIEEVLREVI